METPEEEFPDSGNIHIDHCSRCHLSICPFEDGFGCPITCCPQCSIPLHECKIDEHVEEMCPKTKVTCPNANYGCRRTLRRRLVTAHLKDCQASVVVCSREWARKTVSQNDKLQLKRLGKGIEPNELGEFAETDLDLAAAASDQKIVVRSYSYARKHRVGQRDRMHREHPLMPLREVFNKEGNPCPGPGGHNGEGDSSEEEREMKAAKLRSKRAMFANCYMCQIDPSTQHLHTLGGEAVKFWIGRPVRRYPKPEEKLHHERGLLLDFGVATVTEDKHLLFRKTLYTRRCLRVIHRSEAGNHELSQHQIGLDALGEVVVRCPNWENGCRFTDSRLVPEEGRLRFHNHVDSVVYCPQPPRKKEAQMDFNIEKYPPWVIEEVAKYLPSSALYSLSLVSRSIRSILIDVLEHRHMVEVLWRKTATGWREDGYKYSFSVADTPCRFRWQPAAALATHLESCQFSERKSFKEDRVAVLPPN